MPDTIQLITEAIQQAPSQAVSLVVNSITSADNFSTTEKISNALYPFQGRGVDLLVGNITSSNALGPLEYHFDNSPLAPFYKNKAVVERVILANPQYQIQEYSREKQVYETIIIPASQIVLNTVLVDVRLPRNIVSTDITGSISGSVKEFMGNRDYELEFQGILVNHIKNEFPRDEQALLRKICSTPTSLEVVSDYLQQVFNISNLVITGIEFIQQPGTSNSQIYRISAVSDRPIELQKIKIGTTSNTTSPNL